MRCKHRQYAKITDNIGLITNSLTKRGSNNQMKNLTQQLILNVLVREMFKR